MSGREVTCNISDLFDINRLRKREELLYHTLLNLHRDSSKCISLLLCLGFE